MLHRISQRRCESAHYRFFVWEGGGYVATFAGEFASDHAAVAEAQRHAEPLARPESLDRPHLHVIRQDGVHIITLDLPGQPELPSAATA